MKICETLKLFVCGCLLSLPVPLLAQSPKRAEIRFQDEAQAAGITFEHFSPISPEGHIHLYMGSGVAWFDYDRDGWPDLYFCQGTAFPAEPLELRKSNRLFRNRGDGTFADLTPLAGLLESEHSLGVAAADYDNDGFVDLYVTNFGENVLYHNQGDGTFTEVGRESRVNHPGLGSSCAWGDIDNDGALDLFVVNYLKIDPEKYPLCGKMLNGKWVYLTCHPRQQPGAYDVLYRNCGDGVFDDVTESAGLLKSPASQGLGVIAADLDGDLDTDFFVANDTVPNQLWENRGDGTFLEQGAASGTALNRFGLATASMGVAVGDLDGDSRFELFVTNYFRETSTLYRNEGKLLFLDVTEDVGLAAPSRLRLGFGANFFDPDNDGWLDIFVTNGHVDDRIKAAFGRKEEPFEQLAQFFRSAHGRRFSDESARSGPHFLRPLVGRGSAAADYDRDGRVDLIVQHLNQAPALLHNQTAAAGHWLALELVGTRGNRDGVGAVVTVRSGGRDITCLRQAGNSYLSCDEGRLHVGLGAETLVDQIRVQWPGGAREFWTEITADRAVRLQEGTGMGE